MLSSHWKEILERFIESGLRQKVFCRQENIEFGQFKYQWYSYRKLLQPETTQKPNNPFEPVVLTTPVAIQEEKREAQVTINSVIKLTFANSTQCEFEFSGPVNALSTLLKEVAL